MGAEVSDGESPPPHAASMDAKAIAMDSGTRAAMEETGAGLRVVVWFFMGAQNAGSKALPHCWMQPIPVLRHHLRHFGL
ncbi:MAG TPA: hypothetical protein VFP68_14445 [Burkholderiaceae bacterium]|nr:hypothetical protein [Burkholderiaceae bacterium]